MKIEGEMNVNTLIRKFKQGHGSFSLMNWASVSKLHVSVASVLGVAGLILAARDGKVGNFSSFRRPFEPENCSGRLLTVPGLQNLGNNCFLNVILQALASCSYFGPFMEKIVESCESLSDGEQGERFPLTFALAALLKDLCDACGRSLTLSPSKVMLAMNLYVPNFNLTAQQDAAEAFLHLLSSLREEFSECFVPKLGSLADVSDSTNYRVLPKKKSKKPSEQYRWQQHFLGPFDGIICSTLTCRSCCIEISLDYEFFHSLPLPPVLKSGAPTMLDCTLENCLKQLVVAEHVENYQCSHCWHLASIKYLASIGASKTEIDKLRYCTEQDSCGCRSMFQLEGLPWSNKFSRTYKQLAIARPPKILCLHLQRASMNEVGDLVKVQGHISFPLVLNLLPFMKSEGTKIWEESSWRLQIKKQYEQPAANLQLSQRKISCILGLSGQDGVSEAQNGEKLRRAAENLIGGLRLRASEGESILARTESSSVENMEFWTQLKHKAGQNRLVTVSDAHMYDLVSVVEHYGRAGSGHYTVYRKVHAESNVDNFGRQVDPTHVQWFCISDSEVHPVSEEEVLAAEATLLFYERFVGG